MKLFIKNTLYFCFCLLLLTACSDKGIYMPTGQPLEPIDFAAKIGELPESDPYEVKKVFIDANLLYITVQYEASCTGKDKIELIGSDYLTEAMVPLRQVKLGIHAGESSCKEFKVKTFIINIRELTAIKERDFETDLQIYGWRQKLRYVFVP
jgi:hypothetical protein